MTPDWSWQFAVRLLPSRFKDFSVSFACKASAMLSADLLPKLLPSHSIFSRCMLPFRQVPKDTPSSSQSPLRLRSMDSHDLLCSRACDNSRSRTELSSMPHTVMCCLLLLVTRVSKL